MRLAVTLIGLVILTPPWGLVLADVPGSLVGSHAAPVHCLCISPDGRWVATGDAFGESPGTVIVWELSTRKQVHKLEGHKVGILAVAFSPNSSMVVSASADGIVRIWDTMTGKGLGSIEKIDGRPIGLYFVGKASLAVHLPGKVPIHYDISDLKSPRKMKSSVGTDRPCHAVAFARDGTYLAIGSNPSDPPDDRLTGSIEVLKSDSGKQAVWLPGSYSEIRSLTFDPSGAKLAVGKADHSVDIWSWKDKRRVTLRGHEDEVMSVAFSDRNGLLASASYDGTIIIWDASNKYAKLATLTAHSQAIMAIAFEREGAMLVSGGLDKRVKVWDCSPLLKK